MKRREFLKGLAALALVPFVPADKIEVGMHGHLGPGSSPHIAHDYNAGPREWKQQHCVIYPNGKRKLIYILDRNDWS